VTRPLTVGISTCPNDTFAFHALLHGIVQCDAFDLDFRLGDVEELNQALAAGELSVSKGSFALAIAHSNELCVLNSGAALGFGVGPVLLASRTAAPLCGDSRILSPGSWTTANLLFRLLHPTAPDPTQCVFSEIMPALESGEADYGVCIHEGRFTYEAHGLRLVEDLGSSWEARTRNPLPLGGILARRELGSGPLAALSAAIGRSIDWAREHHGAVLPTMRAHAQEQSDDVLWKHVELYVNDWTRDLGEVGRAAIAALESEARSVGLLGPLAHGLEVQGG
jgi:5,8-dihydroxy-2-naphthoate synthase